MSRTTLSNTQCVVILCESGHKAEFLLADRDIASLKGTYVALNPDVAWVLRKAGVRDARPEDYYNLLDLMEDAEEILVAQIRWPNWVANWLQHATRVRT
jgi:hypothetical protein